MSGINISELPDEILMTASLALAHEHENVSGLLSALMDHVLSQPGSDELREQQADLVRQFVANPPPIPAEDFDPVLMAKCIIGIGAIVEINDQFVNYVQNTLTAIVQGTKDIIGFRDENI